MSIQDIFEEGDTGEAILPVPVSAIAERIKVNGVGVHADRDRSEAPRGDSPLHGKPASRDAKSSVPAWSEADRLRLELGRTWALFFEAKRDLEAAEAKVQRVEALLRDEKRHLHRWIDDSCLVDVEDVLEALS